MKLDKQFIALKNKVMRMEKMGQYAIAKNYKKTLDELRITLTQLYENYEIDGQLTFDEMVKYDRLQKLDKQVYDTITNLYKSNSKVIRGTLAGIVKETYTSSIDIVEGTVKKKLKGIVKDIDVAKTVNTEMAGLKWTERLGKHRVDAIYDVQKEIKLGLTQGDTYGTMAKRLKKELGAGVNKTNQIVRTEGHRCFAQAQQESLDPISKHGVRMTKTWLSSKDERVRGYKSTDTMDHVAMDGVTIPYEDDFELPDGSIGKAPGLIGNYNDINCRCIMVIDIVMDEDKTNNEIELSNDEELALNKYISSDSYKINEKLRSNLELNNDDKRLINDLDSALDKVPVYLGDVTRSLDFMYNTDFEDFIARHQKGALIEYNEYISTTTGETYNPNGQVQIYVLDSTHGKDITKYNLAEQEVVYTRNSKFIVGEIEIINGKHHILLEEYHE